MAYCGKCGKYVPNDSFRCPFCGSISRKNIRGGILSTIKSLSWILLLLGFLALISWLVTSTEFGS